MIYVIAANTRQFLQWCQQNGENPSDVTHVEDVRKAQGIHPEPPTDEVVFLDVPPGWDMTYRRILLEQFGVKDRA